MGAILKWKKELPSSFGACVRHSNIDRLGRRNKEFEEQAWSRESVQAFIAHWLTHWDCSESIGMAGTIPNWRVGTLFSMWSKHCLENTL